MYVLLVRCIRDGSSLGSDFTILPMLRLGIYNSSPSSGLESELKIGLGSGLIGLEFSGLDPSGIPNVYTRYVDLN